MHFIVITKKSLSFSFVQEINEMPERTLFFTLGMFIIDEIHHANPQFPSKYNIVGGGGTFGGLGSRIICPSKRWKDIKLIIDKGSDFPSDIVNYMDSWNIDIEWREDSTRLTTRGWNYYHDADTGNKVETRDFKYLAPKKRIDVSELKRVNTESLHMICSMDRAQEAIEVLRDTDTTIIFEPVPFDCIPERKDKLFKLMSHVDILSPNAKEAADIFELNEPTDKLELEKLALKFIPYLGKKNKFSTGFGAIVLRCGAIGSYTLIKSSLDDEVKGQWYSPYQINPENVVDPTGCGNIFVGSFITGFILSNGDYDIASICGNIGSGVCIETLGMPNLEDNRWNGLNLKERISIYLKNNNLIKDRIYNILDI